MPRDPVQATAAIAYGLCAPAPVDGPPAVSSGTPTPTIPQSATPLGPRPFDIGHWSLDQSDLDPETARAAYATLSNLADFAVALRLEERHLLHQIHANHADPAAPLDLDAMSTEVQLLRRLSLIHTQLLTRLEKTLKLQTPSSASQPTNHNSQPTTHNSQPTTPNSQPNPPILPDSPVTITYQNVDAQEALENANLDRKNPGYKPPPVPEFTITVPPGHPMMKSALVQNHLKSLQGHPP